METFIVGVSLLSAAAGCLILLSALASKRAQLVQAFNIQQKVECRVEPVEEEDPEEKEEEGFEGAHSV